ncbi:MAG: glycosyltransferase 87 family protein [Mycobacteriales bacterium]
MDTRTARRLALLVGVTLACERLTSWLAIDHHAFDIRVYDGAVTSWSRGRDLYSYSLGHRHLGFTYPPFAALLMLPMALLPPYAVIALNAVAIAVGIALLSRVVVGSTFLAGRHGLWFTTAVVVPLAALSQPVRDTLSFGQVNVYLALLVLADLVALRRGARWAGVGAGLATAIKLTPGLFVVFYLLTGQHRAARNAVAAAGGATLLAALVAPTASLRFWTQALMDPSRVGRYDDAANQSLAGVLTRVTDSSHLPTALWLACAVAVLLVGLARAQQAVQRQDLMTAFTLVGLTAGLVSPFTWVHHLVWLVPAVLLLWDVGAQRRSTPLLLLAVATVVLFASGVNDLAGQHTGHHTDHGIWVLLGENAYALWCLGLLLALPTDRVVVTCPRAVRGRMTVEHSREGTAREREQPAPRRGP